MAGRGDMVPSNFGVILREQRVKKGWTQEQLAEMAGLHWNTVARLERGLNEPTWPLVLKMASVLGVSCEVFASASGTVVKPLDDGIEPDPDFATNEDLMRIGIGVDKPEEKPRPMGKRK